MGKLFIIPSIMNINEPLMYSIVVWNPILMIPAWICNIINIVITWVTISLGFVLAPHTNFAFWYLPTPVQGFFLGGPAGAVLSCVTMAVDFVIWYPFFKVYEKQCMIADGQNNMTELEIELEA